MGAESSILQDCHLDEEVASATNGDWSLYPGKTKDGSRVSVFSYKKSTVNRELIDNAAKQLKVLRHPSILRFIGLVSGPDCQRLVTEPVTPVTLVLEFLSPEEICAGIYQIIEALAFLHDRGKVCHNNVCLSSMYINDQSAWVLGGMEHLCQFDQATPTFLNKGKGLREDSAISPEEKAGKLVQDPGYGHVRDAYAFGVMADGLLEYLVDLGDMTKTFELRIQDEFLNPDPLQRPCLHTLLVDRLFQNEFLEVMNFLKNITLKTGEEKKVFFTNVVEKLLRLPSDVVASRLVRHLLSRFVLLDPTADLLLMPHLLTPGKDTERKSSDITGKITPVLPKSLFQAHVIPELFKIFHVRDKHIRMVLLKHFAAYAEQFDRKTLRTTILPQILLGLKDSDDALVAETLSSLSLLVRILGADVVVGPSRNKIFSEGTPKFVSQPPAETSMAKTLQKMNNLSADKTAILNEENARHSLQEKSSPKGKKLADIARQADREQRREEARKRAEERKKKREEKKGSPAKFPFPHPVDQDRPDMMSDPESPSHTPYSETATQNVIDAAASSESTSDNQPVPPGSHECDWSENEEFEDETFEDEIEQELNGMESTISAKHKSKLKHSFPSDAKEEEPPEPVKVDWSDAKVLQRQRDISPANFGKQGALKLKPKSKTSPPPSMASTSQDEQEGGPSWKENEWGSGWGESKSNNQRHNSTASFQGKEKSRLSVVKDVTDDFEDNWGKDWGGDDSHSSPTHSNPSRHSSGDRSTKLFPNLSKPVESGPLGAEFDIMAINIKKKEEKAEEFDFFADMTPVVKKEQLMDLADGILTGKGQSSNKTNQGAQATSSLSFAVVQNTEIDEAAWGDEDLDWGDQEGD